MPETKRILEVNAKHPLIEHLQTLSSRERDAEQVREWIEVLYDQALLTEGRRVEDPNRFAKRVTDLLASAAAAAVGQT